MSDIIQRAAAAAEQVDPSLWVGEDRKAYYERVARAVIEAMREPTDAMVAAGNRLEDRTRVTWRVMIDVALGVS